MSVVGPRGYRGAMEVRVHRPLASAAAATALVAIVACGGSGSGGPTGATGTATLGPRPESTGTLSIVSPTDGETIRGGTVDLVVDLEGAKLVPATTADIVPDEGHLHVILDDQLVSMTSGTEQEIPDVAPGQHLLKVEFVASDHAPFDPRVIAAVSFEVAG
jgi:hypothetical protein